MTALRALAAGPAAPAADPKAAHVPADLDDLLLVLIDLVDELKLPVAARAASGSGTPISSSTWSGIGRCAFVPYSGPLLRPDRCGSCLGSPLENGAA
jgi:hypothetical protein